MTDHEKVQELIRGKEQAPLTFEPQKSALVVVDVQRYFASPEYAFNQVTDKMVPGLTDGYFERVKSYVLDNISYESRSQAHISTCPPRSQKKLIGCGRALTFVIAGWRSTFIGKELGMKFRR